jgi:hypothetical protein
MMMIRTFITVATIATAANAHSYQCYVGRGDQFIDQIPVVMSYRCCSETEALYDTVALKRDLEACTSELRSAFIYNLEDYCNYDFTICSVDYDHFLCDEDFQSLCRDLNGKVIKADFHMRCSDYGVDLSFTILNKVDCVAKYCSEHELMQVYHTTGSEVGCTIEQIANVRVYGDDTPTPTAQPSLLRHKEKDKTNIGLIVGCTVAGAVIMFVILLGFKNREQQVVQPATQTGSAVSDSTKVEKQVSQ